MHPSITVYSINFSILTYIIIGDAKKLSLMVAGLAVGKPASIRSADSAVGKSSGYQSSVITGSTPGVTEFSEVSQITDCYWSGLF